MASPAMKAFWLFALLLAIAGCASTNVSQATATPSGDGTIEISVGEDGFHPSHIAVEHGKRIKLVFVRITDKTCLREVIVYAEDNQRIRRALPRGEPVPIEVTFARPGELGYSCGMMMYGGTIEVR